MIACDLLLHEPSLRRYLARQQMPGSLDADDIVQEVYGRISEMKSLDHVRDYAAFMIGVARNVLLMELRRSRLVSIRSIEDVARSDALSEPTPEDIASDRQQLHLLGLAVARMREPWRTAFMLRVAEDLPHAEIGRRLGMSENAVQKSHAKTLTMLMALLGRGGNASVRATRTRGRSAGKIYGRSRD